MIAAITADLGREGVECLIRSMEPDWAIRAERRLYYPYFWLQLRYAANTSLGRSVLGLSCFVDLRTRVGATTDPFELEHIDPDERDIITPRVDEAEARRIAERYTGYVLRNRRRALVAPTIDVVSCQMVHKPFWIVTCSRAHQPSFRVLVDGITGGFYPLSSHSPRGALAARGRSNA